MGLYPTAGQGERLGLKGAHGSERTVARIELSPPADPLSLTPVSGWYTTAAAPNRAKLETTWTQKQALVSFKNPRRDVVVYLEGEAPATAFDRPPILTVAVEGAGVRFPLETTGRFLKRVHFTAGQLGSTERVDLRLAMSESFVPHARGLGQDRRVRGLLVHHLYVGEAAALGAIPPATIVAAATLTPSGADRAARSRSASAAVGKGTS
jgi:hypothetical protein